MTLKEDVDNLVAEVEENTTVVGSVSTLLNQLTEMLTNLKGQVADPSGHSERDHYARRQQQGNRGRGDREHSRRVMRHYASFAPAWWFAGRGWMLRVGKPWRSHCWPLIRVYRLGGNPG